VLAHTRPATFTVDRLTVSPLRVNIGQQVLIRVVVTNTGDLEGTYQVLLQVRNRQAGGKQVTLAGGDSQRVTFITAGDTVGTHVVTIDSLSQSFEVTEPVVPAPADEEPEPSRPVNWWLMGGVLAAALASLLLLVRRRRLLGTEK